MYYVINNGLFLNVAAPFEVASGQSKVFSMETPDNVAEVTLIVIAVDGIGPTLVISVDVSNDLDTWREVSNSGFLPVSVNVLIGPTVPISARYVRVRWEFFVTGGASGYCVVAANAETRHE
jgi:hypothetical protein